MATSTFAKEILKPKQTALMLDPPPVIIAGRGTPAGTVDPWKNATKGSIYLQTDATDTETCVWVKVAEAEADADWVSLTLTV